MSQDRYYDADEAKIRKQIERRFKERQALWIHFTAFLLTNIMLWAFWALITPTGADVVRPGGETIRQVVNVFPWPLIVTLGWSVGIAAHAITYYNKYGGGAQRREDAIQREIERYRETHAYEKPKNDHLEINDDGEIETIYEDETPSSGRRKRE